MLSNTLRLNFSCMEIIHILHPDYHPKMIGNLLKNKQKAKGVFTHEITQLIIMKIKMKTKNRSHRYNINRPRSRHWHKCSKYKKCLSIMMLICIKQHLSNNWSSFHENVKEHWGWVEQKRCLCKKVCSRWFETTSWTTKANSKTWNWKCNFKYQSNIFASNDQSLLNYNSIFHPSQQPYYGLPSSPLFTPTNSSLIGNYIGSSQSQTQNRAQSLSNTKEMIRKVLKAFYCSFKGILERSAIC